MRFYKQQHQFYCGIDLGTPGVESRSRAGKREGDHQSKQGIDGGLDRVRDAVLPHGLCRDEPFAYPAPIGCCQLLFFFKEIRFLWGIQPLNH